MSRKIIKSADKIYAKLGNSYFEFEYSDGSKEQFRCPDGVMGNLHLSLAGKTNFTIPKGDAPLGYQILQADANRNIAIRVTYPGNKQITMVLSPQFAKTMGEQLLKAAEPHPQPS